MKTHVDVLDTDLLVVGGGAAGCAAAVEAREVAPHLDVTLVDKAHVSRSGCLAMGLNAINAYLPEGVAVDDYVASVRRDAHGVMREDLVRSLAEQINGATHRVESWGLPIPRDGRGRPLPKGPRSIQIFGESLKPILARRVRGCGARVVHRHALVDLRVRDGAVRGAYFLGVRTGELLEVRARAVILATGGAAGLYRTPNRGDARNRMWYCPFNTGAGYAAALRAGAELTTLEMRFVPTRILHTAAPTGTLAQTFGGREENLLGERFHDRYARAWNTDRLTTPQRLRALLEECKAGRGPVVLRLGQTGAGGRDDVLGAYLDMTPAQVALWAAEGLDAGGATVTISTSGPYILGGHTGSGLWVDGGRRATVPGLYAAGDVTGGAPKKYVSGAWVEGFIAARSAAADIAAGALPLPGPRVDAQTEERARALGQPAARGGALDPTDATERLQRVMDEWAGGHSTFYELHGRRLAKARAELEALEGDLAELCGRDPHQRLLAAEVRDRVLTARAVVAHLEAREETRWPGYQTRLDHPEPRDEWRCFVNSRYTPDGRIHTFRRPLRPSPAGPATGGAPCPP